MGEDLFTLRFQLLNDKGSPVKRRKVAHQIAVSLFNRITDRIDKSAFFQSVVRPLSEKGPADDVDALYQASSALNGYTKMFPKAIKEYFVRGVTDPNNEGLWAPRKSDTEQDQEKAQSWEKKKVRHSCDSCGAPLVRKGPARRFGWGLYRCDHCGSEYTIKE